MRASDSVKLFGMNNQLVENALDKVETDEGLNLGRHHKKSIEEDQTYYPQIDRAIRAEAARMAEHYEVFYSLEKTIRGMIVDALEASKGENWWDEPDCIPENIKQAAEADRKRELDTAMTPRSPDLIDFTTFGELSEIIKKNWDVFGDMLSTPKAVSRVMSQLNSLRGPIAHCSPLAEDEVVRLRLSVRDWFRLME